MIKVGSKVLVECVVDKIDTNKDVRLVSTLVDGRESCGGWAGPQMIRPWVEKPPEAAHEVWRTAMSGTTYVVHSDGLVWKHADADGEMTSPAESVPTGDEMLEVLAEYVRSNNR